MRLCATILVGLFVLAACGEDDDEALTVERTLSGAEEVPPVVTGATGMVRATLDGRRLTLTGSFSGLTSDLMPVQGSPAHVHEAPRGQNGPIVFNVVVDSTDRRSGSLQLAVDLTEEQARAFREGRYYLNVHTASHPAGEIRAQLAADQGPGMAADGGQPPPY